jgi:hypothetical protein
LNEIEAPLLTLYSRLSVREKRRATIFSPSGRSGSEERAARLKVRSNWRSGEEISL